MSQVDPLQPTPPRVEHITFQEDTLQTVILDGNEVVLPLRAVCTVLGLNPESQAQSLRGHDVLSQGLRYVRVPVGNRFQTVLAINRRYLYFWLATIRPASVRPEARSKLQVYQEQLVELLDAIYGSDPATHAGGTSTGVVPQTTLTIISSQMRVLAAQLREELAQSTAAQDARIDQIEHMLQQNQTVQGQLDEAQQALLDHIKISAPQQAQIRLAIQRIAKRYETKTGRKIYDMLFARFCAELGTPRYDALPASKYDRARAWLQERATEYLPDDPDALPGTQASML